MRVSLSAKGQIDLRQGGTAPLTPATFEKVDETFAWLRSSATNFISQNTVTNRFSLLKIGRF